MEQGEASPRQRPDSLSNVVRDEFDKLNRRFDSIENKVSDIHATHERIKKEAAFKRQYSEIPPLYGAKHLSLTDYDKIEVEDDDSGDDDGLTPMNKTTCRRRCCCCCTIQ